MKSAGFNVPFKKALPLPDKNNSTWSEAKEELFIQPSCSKKKKLKTKKTSKGKDIFEGFIQSLFSACSEGQDPCF